MKDIFEFNHIDPTLSESEINTLKDLLPQKNTGVLRDLIRVINF